MVCILFILLFKPSSCNGPETKLKCKIGSRTYINNICILSYTDNWCLVRFCMNISGDSPHRMCLCFDFRHTQIYGSLNDTVLCRGWVGVGVGGRELGTQQENYYTKFASVTVTLADRYFLKFNSLAKQEIP